MTCPDCLAALRFPRGLDHVISRPALAAKDIGGSEQAGSGRKQLDMQVCLIALYDDAFSQRNRAIYDLEIFRTTD